jgi:hypothetical protein
MIMAVSKILLFRSDRFYVGDFGGELNGPPWGKDCVELILQAVKSASFEVDGEAELEMECRWIFSVKKEHEVFGVGVERDFVRQDVRNAWICSIHWSRSLSQWITRKQSAYLEPLCNIVEGAIRQLANPSEVRWMTPEEYNNYAIFPSRLR